MESQNTIRELAFRYFAGGAGENEEKVLYEYVAQDFSHLKLLRQWESEWAAAGEVAQGTAREWERLKMRLELREDVGRYITPMRSLWRRVASYAAVAVVGACGLFGVWNMAANLAPAKYYTVEVPLGEKSRIVLSDGTVVWLNAGSTLRYSDRFNAFNRRVELTGEGYFEVTKQRGAAFRVNTGAYEVKVTGTRFDVSAYPEDAFVTTTLVEGSVELLRGRRKIEMTAGESVQFDRNNGNFVRSYVDAEQAHSWTENRIEFDNITLRMLLARLARQYNVAIHLESERVKEKRFHVSLRNDETIREVLDALKDIIPVRYEIKDGGIYINEVRD